MMRLFETMLFLPEGTRSVSSFGSILHGALMERLPKELATRLHEQDMRPYSQGVFWDKAAGVARWRIGIVEEETGEAIEATLCRGGEIFLRQKGCAVRLGELRLLQQSDFSEIADAFFLPEAPPKGAGISFLAPTSFKREGRYVMLPDFFLICQSLLLRWNRFSERIRLEEPALAEKLADACCLSQYALRSAPFSVEAHTIRGFQGDMRVRFFGTDAVRRILGMLFAFAPFVGVGIKTALGMGAVRTEVWGNESGQ